MDFYKVTDNRESIRRYDPAKPIPQTLLKRILETGRIAPSASNLQPWKFILVSSPEMLEKVRPCYARGWFWDAPHILIVTGDREVAWKRSDGYNSIETDLTIAMDHMILAAENEGIGTCWIAHFDNELLRRVLKLGKNEVIFAITPLGYMPKGAKKSGKKNRKPFQEVVMFI